MRAWHPMSVMLREWLGTVARYGQQELFPVRNHQEMQVSVDDELRKHRNSGKWRACVEQYVNGLGKCKDSREEQEQFCREQRLDLPAFRWWVKCINREDEYTFYASFVSERLDTARRSLDLLEQYIDEIPQLRMPPLRDAIVSYAALFAKSNRRIAGHIRLDGRFVPETLRCTHDRVWPLRNRIVAHCDIRPRNPKVAPFGIFLRGSGYYWDDYIALLPPFRRLIEAVRANVDDYCRTAGLTSPPAAFEDIPDRPPAAWEEPGASSGVQGTESVE